MNKKYTVILYKPHDNSSEEGEIFFKNCTEVIVNSRGELQFKDDDNIQHCTDLRWQYYEKTTT